ncbi:MAG: alginate lyase family protein [Gammaproteobacteria bacterium]|nr:alginate lyase family protein [Gammaproteobacteria bacterium]
MLYWHTLRHLRPVQIYGRLWFRVSRPKPDLSPPPNLRRGRGAWLAPAETAPSLVGPGQFVLLDQPGSLAELGWDGSQRDKLWRYNQHYFHDLNARNAGRRATWHRELLLDWVDQNPPGTGTGWEPYPTSLRMVNWIKWALAGNALPAACVRSLAVQARWLTGRLETHLLGNHLFANAKALVFAGLYFEGLEADRWLRLGLDILDREVPEQILADGGHFERSPMYHALALEDMLDLCNVGSAYISKLDDFGRHQLEQWQARLPLMCAWLNAMSHPDGEIALFNDAALGVAPSPQQLNDYADRLGISKHHISGQVFYMEDSGYVRISLNDVVLLIDVAPVGPDYLPAHAHADTLSFELSLSGERTIVNGGTSRYGRGPLREAERGTAAHSTVQIDGENSSEVWAGFRVGRRARTFDVSVRQDGDAVVVDAAHDGYKRLPGRPVHRRQWRIRRGSLEVNDSIEGRYTSAVARFHMHPDVKTLACENNDGESRSGQSKIQWASSASGVRIRPGVWHPKFGVEEPNECIEVPIDPVGDQGTTRFLLRWERA